MNIDQQRQWDHEDTLVQVRRLQEIGTRKRAAQKLVDGLKIQLRKAKDELRMEEQRFDAQAERVGFADPLPLFDRSPEPSPPLGENLEQASFLPPEEPPVQPASDE